MFTAGHIILVRASSQSITQGAGYAKSYKSQGLPQHIRKSHTLHFQTIWNWTGSW